MSFEGRETLSSSDGGSKVYLKYRCPRPGCPKGTVKFLEGSGFKNPYVHLRSCFGRGQPMIEQEKTLNKLLDEAREAVFTLCFYFYDRVRQITLWLGSTCLSLQYTVGTCLR